jgi:peptidoglycan-associated lipoprotein
MKRKVWPLIVFAVVSTFVVGCRKKAPVTAAAIPPPAPPVALAAAPPPPAAEAPPAYDPWSGDLDSLNAYIREHGLLADVYFDYDRAELRQDAREQLAKNGRFLAEHPDLVVAIEGHCDERGTNAYNLALGQSRAYVAKEYLGQLGAGAQRLQTISYGKERPVCGEEHEDCWWRNRRARFVVVGRSGAAGRPS